MAEQILQEVYRKSPEEVISYDWADVRDGTGYAVFYGGNMAGTTYTSPNTFYSGLLTKNGETVTCAPANTYVLALDFDWDIIFNNPKDIFGDILTSIPFGIKVVSATTDIFTFYTDLLVYHYDGVTETQIGSTATSEVIQQSNSEAGDIISSISTLKVNASTVKHFKEGDILRFTMKLYVKCSEVNKTAIGGIGCDPMNRSDDLLPTTVPAVYQVIKTNYPTQLKFQIPFRTN
jgi:hypothetical protein